MNSADCPLVSIVTPSFNQGEFIERTIESVLSQTYKNIEYIVLDAMSSDRTPEILDRYRDKISVTRREPDRGQSDAIVKGFKLARGELVGWVNSDDLLYPECVTRIVEAYRRRPDASIFYCSSIDIISESGERLKTTHVPLRGRDHLLRECNTLIQPGSFYRRTALKAVDYFDTSLRYSMDLDLWLRLLAVGGFVDVSETPIAAYREWGGTKTSTGGARLAKERIAMLTLHGGNRSDNAQKKLRLKIFKEQVKTVIRKVSPPSIAEKI
jgi:glycosyltransferase involved in cell wall biosynthesis